MKRSILIDILKVLLISSSMMITSILILLVSTKTLVEIRIIMLSLWCLVYMPMVMYSYKNNVNPMRSVILTTMKCGLALVVWALLFHFILGG